MGNIGKKIQDKLKRRQADFDSLRDKQGRKRPGSLNRHKQGAGGAAGGKKRR